RRPGVPQGTVGAGPAAVGEDPGCGRLVRRAAQRPALPAPGASRPGRPDPARRGRHPVGPRRDRGPLRLPPRPRPYLPARAWGEPRPSGGRDAGPGTEPGFAVAVSAVGIVARTGRFL